MKKLVCFVLIFTSLASYRLQAQSIQVKARIDTAKILIGDQVRLILEVNNPAKFKVFFPDFKDSIAGKVELVEKLKTDTISSYKENKLIQKYVITSFDSGFYQIPPIKVEFVYNGIKDSAFSNPLSLQVFTMPIDTTKNAIADIKNIIDVPLTFREIVARFLPYAIALLVILVLAFAGWYLYKKLKKKQPILKVFNKPKEPAHIIALRELDRIRNEKLWQKNMVKDFHSQLTEVIRRYIEDRYQINAMEYTTEETLQVFQNAKVADDKVYVALKQMLGLADMVKFAKHQPIPDENDTSLKNAYFFIDNTTAVIIKEIAENENKDVNLNSEVK